MCDFRHRDAGKRALDSSWETCSVLLLCDLALTQAGLTLIPGELVGSR